MSAKDSDPHSAAEGKKVAIICFCNNISEAQIRESIAAGAKNLRDIYDRTSAGVGPCGGSCRQNIWGLLNESQAKDSTQASSWVPPIELAEAVSLFNRRYYWETHEVLEHLWLEERGDTKLFYQGLIQAAAALYHVLNANPKGVLKLAEEAQNKLRKFSPSYQTIPVDSLIDHLGQFLLDAKEILGGTKSGFNYDQLPKLTIGDKMGLK